MISTVGRPVGKQSIHDRVIALVAKRQTNPTKYNITTNLGSEKNRWAGSERNYPDLVGWLPGGLRDRLVWVAEVETEESTSEGEARGQWQGYAALPVPFYLIVPRGYGAIAHQLAIKAGLPVTAVYEYSFVNGTFQLSS